MRYSFLTNIGVVRQNNEDAAWSGENKYKNYAGLVCDGLGGYKGGSAASEITVSLFKERFENTNFSDFDETQISEWVDRTITKAREEILKHVEKNPQLANMATTFVCCLIINYEAYIYNIGDSRSYLISKRKSYQITEDQNLLNYLIKNKASKKHFEIHKENLYAITQFVGAINHKTLKIDYFHISLQPKDIIVLSSDGTHNWISIQEMIKSIIFEENFSDACNSIISKALANKSNDNLSIVILGD